MTDAEVMEQARLLTEQWQKGQGHEEDSQWWLVRRQVGEGAGSSVADNTTATLLWLHPMALGNLRLSLGPADSLCFWSQYCYHNRLDAFRAALTWDGQGDPPEGWVRHVQTGRRRPHGNADEEYIAF